MKNNIITKALNAIAKVNIWLITALFCLAPIGGYGIWYWATIGLTTPLDWVFAVVEFFVFFGFLYGGILWLIEMPFSQFVKQMRSNIAELHRRK